MDPEKLVNEYAALVDASHAKIVDAQRALDAALAMQPCAEQVKLLDGADALFKESDEINVKAKAVFRDAYAALEPHIGAEKMKALEKAAIASGQADGKERGRLLDARVAAYAAQYGG